MRLKITERDEALLQGLYEFGVLSRNQIQTVLFADTNINTINRRLRKLRSLNFVESVWGLPNGQLVWLLGKKGGEYLAIDRPLKGINKNVLRHDVLVSDLRIALESVGVGYNWQSGHWMRAELGVHRSMKEKRKLNIPDWLVDIQFGEQSRVVALELELNTKSKSRICQTLLDYSKKSAIGLVWYVVPNKQLGDKLLKECRYMEERGHSIKLAWSLLDEYLADPLNVKMNFMRGNYALKELI